MDFNKINNIVILEKTLWHAYNQVRKELEPALPTFSLLRRIFQLNRNKLLKWYYNHPAYLILIIIFGMVGVFSVLRPMFFIFYAGSLIMLFISKEKYDNAYLISIGAEKYKICGFGINYWPMYMDRMAKSIDGYKGDKKSNILKIIDLTRSGDSYWEVSFGFNKMMKTGILGLIPIIFIYTKNNFDYIINRMDYLSNKISGGYYVLTGISVLLILFIFMVLYSVYIEPVIVNRKKKKFLALLAMLATHFDSKKITSNAIF